MDKKPKIDVAKLLDDTHMRRIAQLEKQLREANATIMGLCKALADAETRAATTRSSRAN